MKIFHIILRKYIEKSIIQIFDLLGMGLYFRTRNFIAYFILVI